MVSHRPEGSFWVWVKMSVRALLIQMACTELLREDEVSY